MTEGDGRQRIPRWLVWAMRATGVFTLAVTGFIYVDALLNGGWPSGHPWRGVSKVALAVMFFTMLPRPKGVVRVICFVSIAVGMVGGVLSLIGNHR